MKSVARLYTQFHPTSYDLAITLNESALRFSGSVTIQGKKVGRPSQRITLHQHDLKVTSATITRHDKKGDQAIAISRINNQDSLNEVRLHSEQMLYPGEYTVYLEFEAPITKGMTGIYPSYFKDGDQEKVLLSTQFESHHAREAFPCIDEPEAKAVFNLTLMTRQDVSILANTPQKTQTTRDGMLVTSFDPTPVMTPYLLAFVVGDLHKRSTKTSRGTEVSVWATTAQPADSLDYGLDIGKRSIEFFEEYFGVDYPLAKMDLVAIPDFSAGAMENWGLVTYRERVLLAYPNETAQSVREQIALVIAHETSHQWFGNLVTMRWWNDLWLNESFANMMEYQAVDSMFPEWHIWDSFMSGEGLSALRRDAVPGVQAVRTAVNHPDEISSLFDPSIVYAKGGRLLYMLKSYIGEEAFRTGLAQYFTAHAYGNTEGSDLWACLSQTSGKDIAAFMDPWLTRSGFPVVSIMQDGKNISLTQEQFLDNPQKVDHQRLWPVPLFASQSVQPDILQKREQQLAVNNDATVILNNDARGHYIVRYVTDAKKQAVITKVADKSLTGPERLMLLNAGIMLARAGYEPYGNVLTMLNAYATETSEAVWGIMSLVIGDARRFIDLDETLEDKIKPFVSKLISLQYERLGWDEVENESAADQKLRALILSLGAYAENKAIIERSTELFKSYMQDQAPLPPELRALVFIVPIKNGDIEAFQFLLELHDTTQNSDLQGDICDALTATRDPKQAALLLERMKDSKLVKPQDTDRWLVYLLRNRYTRATAWDWMVTNWQWLEETFKNDKSYDYLPRYAATCVNTPEYQQKFSDLFADKVDQIILKRNIEMGLEEIANRVAWLKRDLPSVQQFFS